MTNNTTNNDKLKEITDGIQKEIQALFESDKYKQYLRTMARFPRYSLNNTILIFLQNPEATLVAGYGRWQQEFERHVKKGEKGIKIIAPAPYKKLKEIDKLDPVTKKPLVDATGRVQKEEIEIKVPMFKPVTVFDVSQTEGKPLPELATSLEGTVEDYQTLLTVLKRIAPVRISFETMEERKDGFFSPTEQRIAIRSGMSEAQTVSALIHEIAHSILHNRNPEANVNENAVTPTEPPKNRRIQEVEALYSCFLNVD